MKISNRENGSCLGRRAAQGAKPAARGFTLLELLFVVATIAILAAIAVPNFLEAQVRGKRTEIEQSMAILADALDAYELDQGEMPPNVVGDPTGYYALYDNSRALARLTTPIAYIGSLPRDLFYYGGYRRGTGRESEWPGERNQAVGYWRFDPDSVEKALTPRAVLVSIGPNGDIDHYVAGDSLHVTSYDPSNGSTSLGDLFLTLPSGFYVPEWNMARLFDEGNDWGTTGAVNPAPDLYKAKGGSGSASEDEDD